MKVDDLLTDIPFGASSDMRYLVEYLGHDLGLLGQRQALLRAHNGTTAEHDQMDDGGICAGDRNSGTPEASGHRPPHPIARPGQNSLLDTMVHGHHLLSLAYGDGHGIDPAVLASQGALGFFASSGLSGPKGVGGPGILGKQFVQSPTASQYRTDRVQRPPRSSTSTLQYTQRLFCGVSSCPSRRSWRCAARLASVSCRCRSALVWERIGLTVIRSACVAIVKTTGVPTLLSQDVSCKQTHALNPK